MKTRIDVIYADGEWETSARENVLHLPVPANVLFVCLFLNVIYVVVAQWLPSQAVLSYFSIYMECYCARK